MMLGLRYDLRAPAFGAPAPALYRAALEQCAWADKVGFDFVAVSEHHGSEDGYCPSPMVLAAGIAGATQNIGIQLMVLVVTLHHPLRAAEDIAVLDLVSGGRLMVCLGAGYRESEFAMFGKDMHGRAKAMDRIVPVLKQAWTGEPFEYEGVEVRVTPRPLQQPHPPLFLGGQTAAAARRAARLGDGFIPSTADQAIYDEYHAERERLGLPPGIAFGSTGGPLFLHVAEDPDAAWAKIAPHARHESSSYLEWNRDMPVNVYSGLTDDASLRASGLYAVLTPDECVEMGKAMGPFDAFVFHPLMGGLDPDLAFESLELFASKVLPRLDR
jgi:alkanesulfonate monooxygenase SsuD/methylene tetrahydromethanopterin reductase-like flavin-dependent oxidoreductase (luciferase family)